MIFDVTITVTLKQTIAIEAETKEEAKYIVDNQYCNGTIELDDDNDLYNYYIEAKGK